MTMCKKVDRSPHQKNMVFTVSKWVALSLDVWSSTRLLQNICLLLDLLYHKRKLLITTAWKKHLRFITWEKKYHFYPGILMMKY